MKIRAAVLEEFGKPLVVREVDLAEPGPRRGAGAPGRLRRLPHRPVHGLGRRPLGLRADGARPRGRGRRRARRRGRHARRARRSRRDAVLAAVRRVRPLPQPADEPVPGDPRAAEPGLPARRHDAPVARRRAAAPLHGHLDLRRVHRDAARSRSRKIDPRGAARPRLPVRLRPLDRPRRGDAHGRACAPGSTCVVFGAGMVGLGAVAGCRLQGAERIVCVDLSPERLELARGPGRDRPARGRPRRRSRRSSR